VGFVDLGLLVMSGIVCCLGTSLLVLDSFLWKLGKGNPEQGVESVGKMLWYVVCIP